MAIYKTMRKAAEAHAGAHASRVKDWEAYELQLLRRGVVMARKDESRARDGYYQEYVVIEPGDWFGIDRDGRILSGPHKMLREVKADFGAERVKRFDVPLQRGNKAETQGLYFTGAGADTKLIGKAWALLAAGYHLHFEAE